VTSPSASASEVMTVWRYRNENIIQSINQSINHYLYQAKPIAIKPDKKKKKATGRKNN